MTPGSPNSSIPKSPDTPLPQENDLPNSPPAYPATRLRVVAMGGGTGLSTLLRGLKRYVASPTASAASTAGAEPALPSLISDLAAIVTVTDDGGSSGRLRKDFNILPPGDLRNCMVALSEDEHAHLPPLPPSLPQRRGARRAQLRQPLCRRPRGNYRRLRPGHQALVAGSRHPRPHLSRHRRQCPPRRPHGRRLPGPGRNQHHRQQKPHRSANAGAGRSRSPA